MKPNLAQEKFRELCWDIGTRFPEPHQGNRVVLTSIRPHQGYIHWNLEQAAVSELQAKVGHAFDGACLVVRIYDVTDVLFDGLNAHGFFDVDVDGLSGTRYMHMDQSERNFVAEIGFRLTDGAFHALARSQTVFFDRGRPSGNFQVGALFVGKGFRLVFDVENACDVGEYERLNQILGDVKRHEPLSLAMVHIGIGEEANWKGPLGSSIIQVSQACEKLGGMVCQFPNEGTALTIAKDACRPGSLEKLGEKLYRELAAQHQRTPFHLVHCHDWSSTGVGLRAKASLGIPLVFSLHSTEHERSQAHQLDVESERICNLEKEAVQAADLIIVPHSSTRQQVIRIYSADPDRVVIIPDLIEEAHGSAADGTEQKHSFGFPSEARVALFAGEMSHAAGADLFVDALPTVCEGDTGAHFAFAGEGPLKGELEGRAWHMGVGHRTHFFGDMSREAFEALLLASDFVVIPARTWQDEGLAQWAIACGRPVLTTHQAHLPCVVHGQNGLVTYDNPGSIIWGLKELLANPSQGHMMRQIAQHRGREGPLLENVAVEHYVYYESVLKHDGMEDHA